MESIQKIVSTTEKMDEARSGGNNLLNELTVNSLQAFHDLS